MESVAGLLLQQGARRLLRADRLPDGVAEGEPPARVHGRADLVGHEHEGQGAVLRQRVPRARDRGAAARRQLVAERLRRRRGQDPLRPERGQERRRLGRARDHPRAARTGRSRRSGTSPSGSTRRFVNKRALESLVKCGALDSTGAPRKGMLDVLEQAPRLGPAAAGRPARRAGLDLRPRRRARPTRGRATTRRSRRASSRRPSCCGLEKETLGLYVSEHPLQRHPRPAAPAHRLRRSPSSSGAATARSSPSAGSSARSSS